MKKSLLCINLSLASLILALPGSALAAVKAYNSNPPFKLSRLDSVKVTVNGKKVRAYNPKNPYEIFINYELGMHCVGFDISYCCVIPPYNSIQAQAIKAGSDGALPHLLTPDDGLKLRYWVKQNSYDEGNKMKFWSVTKHIGGNGTADSPGDDMPNYVWTHLFIYKDLKGTIPKDWTKASRLHVGKQIQVNLDAGPSGKPLAGGFLDYAGPTGGNKVFTDSQLAAVPNVQLTLTASNIWDALGLPLTAFNDNTRKGTIRSITPDDFQPFQYSMVQLDREDGKPLIYNGKKVQFFGTNPVDIPNCYLCHSGKGPAARASRKDGLTLLDKEYEYWKKYPDISDFMARMSSASIGILQLHDKNFGTHFLKDYNPNAVTHRLGSVGPVYCADCHGDNISGNLQTPRPDATGYKVVKAMPLTQAIHEAHATFVPMPDKAGRTQNCQSCHPMHWQPKGMNEPGHNPYRVLDNDGNPRFTHKDVRTAGGGCYLRRDAHTNPKAKPPYFLNSVGKWFYANVSTRTATGKKSRKLIGLYCTDCHNDLTQALYRHDNFTDSTTQAGTTLRNKPIGDIIKAVADGNVETFKTYYADPTVGAAGDPLVSYYSKHTGDTLVRASKDSAGKLKLLAWNAKDGNPVSYDAASGGSDWWLAASEPHCADCHEAPFVESDGGKYFPIDQPGKYSLYRYSKAHGDLACQSCHESIHGLYPVRFDGAKKSVDVTTHKQALQFSPDGKYAGPVTCAACHTVDSKGVPVQLAGTGYAKDYWASVALIHFMRSGDQKLPIAELMKKFPYQQSKEVVVNGWK